MIFGLHFKKLIIVSPANFFNEHAVICDLLPSSDDFDGFSKLVWEKYRCMRD